MGACGGHQGQGMKPPESQQTLARGLVSQPARACDAEPTRPKNPKESEAPGDRRGLPGVTTHIKSTEAGARPRSRLNSWRAGVARKGLYVAGGLRPTRSPLEPARASASGTRGGPSSHMARRGPSDTDTRSSPWIDWKGVMRAEPTPSNQGDVGACRPSIIQPAENRSPATRFEFEFEPDSRCFRSVRVCASMWPRFSKSLFRSLALSLCTHSGFGILSCSCCWIDQSIDQLMDRSSCLTYASD